jgi:CubicO group peptidase (beta-lactamase class C family)
MRSALLTGLLLILPAAAHAQQLAADDPLQGLDAYITQAVEDWKVPGLAMAVVKDDSVVFVGSYGVRALGSSDPITPHTLFANASTTKAFTSMAIAMLVDQGKLAWDDPVARYLPTFVLRDPYATRELTLRDLLTHRVGFGDPGFLWYGVEFAYRDMVQRLRHVEPASSFRSQFAYNNVAYATAGVIAGTVAGTGWDDLVAQRILDPLAMGETVTQGRLLADRDNVALPHDRIADTVKVIDGIGLVDRIAAAGAMYSSVLDMTRWIRFLLNDAAVDGRQLVSDSAFAEIFRPQIIVSEDQFYPTAQLTRPHFTAYGLGWFLQDYHGEFVAFHTGSIDGTVAIVGLMPDQELGLVVFANRDHVELRHALMLRVFDSYLGGPQRDWSTELRVLYDGLAQEAREQEAKVEEQRVTGTQPTLPLADYVGAYTDSLFGSVRIWLEGSSLVLERSPFLTADLSHWHYDVFRTVWRHRWLGDGLVTFRIGADGKVAALEAQGRVLGRVREPERDSGNG